MKRSFLSKLSGAVVALALGVTGLGVVGAASPAGAAETCTSKATLTLQPGYASQRPSPYFGQSLYIDGDVTYTCPSDSYPYHVNAGTVSLQRTTGGAWATIATFSNGFPYLSTKYVGTASYRLVYSGGTDSSGDTLTPAVSSNVATGVVYRALTAKAKAGKKAKVTFVVSPAASIAGIKATLQIKKGKKWKKFKRPKFNRSGKAVVRLGNTQHKKKGTPYRLIVPAGRGFGGSVFSFTIVTRYYRSTL
jgi:hypothetical protein